MLDLDIYTLLVVTALVSSGAAVALFFLWRSLSQKNGTGFWVVGMVCIAVASILFSGRGIFPYLISTVIANSLYIVGFCFFLRGMRVFTGRPPLLFFDLILPPITIVLFYYFTYIEQSLGIRIVILSSLFIIICCVIVFFLLQDKNAHWPVAVAVIFALFAVFHALRVAIVLFPSLEYSLMNVNVFSSLLLLAWIFILGGSAITLILVAQKSLESELRIASLAVNQTASSIMITDKTGNIEYVNPACTQITGYLLPELVGQNPRILSSGEMNAEEYATLWKTISAGGIWRGEFHNRKKNGEFFWEVSSIAPVKKMNGDVTHYVAVKEDITALKNAEERILHMANHDALTKLPTRRLAMDRLLSNMAIARRNKTKVAILFLDLDGFKGINDTFGHDYGDLVLKETAVRLSSCVRDVDTVARVGGDEFWILLSNMTDKNNIRSVANKLLKTVATSYKAKNEEITIGASIGIALYPDNGVTALDLVNLADQAMYTIKRKGKNNYAFVEAISGSDFS